MSSHMLKRYIELRRKARDLRAAEQCAPISDEVVALMVIAEVVMTHLVGIEQSLDHMN
jgi:hypothetical protein